MGKPIVYCVNCGRSLKEDDFLRRRAHTVDNRPWCAGCKPPPAEPPSRPRGSIPVITPRRPMPAAPARSKAPILFGAAFALALPLLLLFAQKDAPRPATRPVTAAPAPAQASPKAPASLEPAAPAADATDRYMGMIRELRARDVDFRKRHEVKNLLEATRRQAGTRAGEVDRLEADYDRAFEDAARKAADAAAAEARALAAKGQPAEALARLEELPAPFAETEPARKLATLREEFRRGPAPLPAAAGTPAGAPPIVLSATTAKVKNAGGLTLKKNEYLGSWHTDQDAAEWLAAPAAGRWKVELVYAADPAGGGTLALTLGAAKLEWAVVSTGSFKTYATAELGVVTLPGGATPVVARGRGTKKQGLLNLRELRLTPLP